MLNPDLVEPILEKLGLRSRPAPDLAGLSEVYGRWSRIVPFDNIQKRLFYSGAAVGPVPGHNSAHFFEQWLAHGTGGTCWSNSHAMHDLLEALGFTVERAAGTMLSAPDVAGPTHGSVVAAVDGQSYLVDGSMLTRRPVPVEDGTLPSPEHPAERVHVEMKDGLWHVRWHPAHRPEGLWCRFETIGVPLLQFNEYHERTRTRSGFNAALYIRQNRPDGVATLAFGERMSTAADGQVDRSLVSHPEAVQALVEEFGISEEAASQLPPDVPAAS